MHTTFSGKLPEIGTPVIINYYSSKGVPGTLRGWTTIHEEGVEMLMAVVQLVDDELLRAVSPYMAVPFDRIAVIAQES